MHQLDESKLLDLASGLLLSDDARRLAREAREAFRQGVRGVRWKPTDAELQEFCASFDQRVLPILDSLTPNRRLSARIRSGLGRMFFMRFLQNAACSSSASLRKLSQRYARDLLAFGSRTFHLRTVVPIRAFDSERGFSLKGRRGREQYHCRFVKLNGRLPEFLGHYVFPTPADYARPHLSDIQESAEWAAVIDVVAPRFKDGDVGRSEPSVRHLPRALVTAMRLFAEGEVHYVREYTTYKALDMGSFIAWKHEDSGGLAPLRFTRTMIRRFQKWWRCLEPHVPFDQKLPPRLALAISYFDSSYGKFAEARFLDLHIALEALADVSTEHTYRLPLRVSALLSRTKDEALQLAEDAKSYWGIRCKIAHGAKDIRKPKFQKEVHARLPQLRGLVRRMIEAHLRLFEEDQRDMDAYEREIKEFDKTRILTRGYRR